MALALSVTEPREVLVVDSGSTDDTAAAARAAGAEVVVGPPGKGAAMEMGVRAATGEWIAFLDADLTYAECPIPEALSDAVVSDVGDHVVGDFDDGLGAVLTNTHGFYEPLVAGLFPEVVNRFGGKPLTGFRALRRQFIELPLPRDFGVEAHLNITSVLAGARTVLIDLGRFDGKLKQNKIRSYEITGAILDLAVRFGRIRVDQRPAWEDWVDSVYAVAATWEEDANQAEYRERLIAASQTPLPTGEAAWLRPLQDYE